MVLGVICWFLVLVALVFIEAISADLLTVWFMPATVVCIILAALKYSFSIQVIVFFVLSAIFVVLSKTVFRKHIVRKRNSKTNIDLIVGETGVVQEEINNIASVGLVKVKSQLWTARSNDDLVKFKIGEHVQIVGIEGVKLICKKADE